MANFLQALLAAVNGGGQPGIQSVDPDTGLPTNGPILNGGPGPQPQQGSLTPDWFSQTMGTDMPQGQPVQPQQGGLTPDWFSGVMGQDMPGAGNGQPVNLLEGLGYDGQPNAGGNANVAAPQPARAPRERRTVLDSVGRIADVLAKVGGAEALYQPSLDAREDRGFAIEDRARGIDMDRLKLTLAQQQVQGGAADLANANTTKLGLAMRGLQAIQARGGDPNQAWPLLAQQMGIEPETVRVIGEQIQSNPNAITGLAAAINGGQNQGDNFGLQPFFAKGPNGEVRAYQLGRDGRVNPIALPEGFSPADQTGQIDNGGANIIYDRRTGQPIRVIPREGGPVAGERPIVDAQGRVTGYEPVQGSNLQVTRETRQGQQNVPRLNPTQRGAVMQTRESIPGIRQTLDRVETLDREMQEDGSYARGYVGGQIPGQLVGGKAAEFDKAQALLAAQIRTLIRTTGEGSMSDYESRLNAATVPSRTDSDEGRAESIRNLRALLGEVQARSDRLLAPPAQQQQRQGGGGGQRRPQGNGGGQRQQQPQVRRVNAPPGVRARVDRPSGSQGNGPRVGAVVDGYRFRGGNPASRNSWEKVR
jgi:hypothetical protein